MPLVLAIESDPKQATILKRIMHDYVHADLVLSDSKDTAVTALGDRVPDLILATALLSPRDEAELTEHLRTLDDAEHLQTLTIPLLAAAPSEEKKVRGFLSAFTRKRTVTGPERCDPGVFGSQLKGYLDRAVDMRAERAALRAREARRAALEAPVAGQDGQHRSDAIEPATAEVRLSEPAAEPEPVDVASALHAAPIDLTPVLAASQIPIGTSADLSPVTETIPSVEAVETVAAEQHASPAVFPSSEEVEPPELVEQADAQVPLTAQAVQLESTDARVQSLDQTAHVEAEAAPVLESLVVAGAEAATESRFDPTIEIVTPELVLEAVEPRADIADIAGDDTAPATSLLDSADDPIELLSGEIPFLGEIPFFVAETAIAEPEGQGANRTDAEAFVAPTEIPIVDFFDSTAIFAEDLAEAVPAAPDSHQKAEEYEAAAPAPSQLAPSVVFDAMAEPEAAELMSSSVAPSVQVESWEPLSQWSTPWPALGFHVSTDPPKPRADEVSMVEFAPSATSITPLTEQPAPLTEQAAPRDPAMEPPPASPAPNAEHPARAIEHVTDLRDIIDSLRHEILALRDLTINAPPQVQPSAHEEAILAPEHQQQPVRPKAVVKLRAKAGRQHPSKPRPLQDEWGIYDPNQCGFDALFAAIETNGEERDAVREEPSAADLPLDPPGTATAGSVTPAVQPVACEEPPVEHRLPSGSRTQGRGLAPLAMWAHAARTGGTKAWKAAELAEQPGDALRALLNGLRLPAAIAAVSYPTGCRIHRVRVRARKRRRSGTPGDGQVLILSRKLLRSLSSREAAMKAAVHETVHAAY